MKGITTIISTQPIDQAEKLSELIQSESLVCLKMPLIKTEAVNINKEFKRTISQIQQFNLIIFTSKRGITAFFALLEELKLAVSHIKKQKIAVIGSASAKTLSNYGIKADFVNSGSTSKDFLSYLLNNVVKKNDKILFALGNLASNLLPDEISTIASVKRINVYNTIKIKEVDQLILNKIKQDSYNLIVFTSPSAFENFIEITNFKAHSNKLNILSIGQTTANTIEKYGFKVLITAKESTNEGLAKEIKKFKERYINNSHQGIINNNFVF